MPSFYLPRSVIIFIFWTSYQFNVCTCIDIHVAQFGLVLIFDVVTLLWSRMCLCHSSTLLENEQVSRTLSDMYVMYVYRVLSSGKGRGWHPQAPPPIMLHAEVIWGKKSKFKRITSPPPPPPKKKKFLDRTLIYTYMQECDFSD